MDICCLLQGTFTSSYFTYSCSLAKILNDALEECTKKYLVRGKKVKRFIEIMVEERMDGW